MVDETLPFTKQIENKLKDYVASLGKKDYMFNTNMNLLIKITTQEIEKLTQNYTQEIEEMEKQNRFLKETLLSL